MSQRVKFQRLGSTWRLAEIVGSVLVLILITYAMTAAFLQPDNGMSWNTSFRVSALLPDGPAEQAGIRLDDRVVTINGYRVDAWHFPIAQWRSGDTLSVIVNRDGQRLSRSIKLTSLSWSARMELITPLIVALSFWAISLLTLGPTQQSWSIRLFRAFCQLGSAVLSTGNLSGMGLVWAGHLFGILSGALAPVILHFHLTLPGAHLRRWRRPTLWVAYAVGAVLALPYLLLGSVSYWWRAGWGNRGLRITLFISLLVSLIWLGYSYVTTPSPRVQRRLRVVVLGTVWGFIPVLLLSMLPDVLGFPPVPYPLTMLFLALIPITYWYVIVRFDLLRADLVLNRSLIYLSLAFIPSFTYIITVRLVDRFLSDAAFPRELIGILLLAVTGVAAVPLRALIQRVIGHAFFGGWYNYQSVVGDVSRHLTGELDRRALEESLLLYVANALWVRDAALLLPEARSSGRLVGRQHGTPLADPSLLSLEVDGSLGRYLCRARSPIEASQLRQEMIQVHLKLSEEMLLSNKAIRWWVPMISDEKLLGLLLLGARTGHERLGADDLKILCTLSDQIVVAIKNVLMVEELRSQKKSIETSHRALEQMHQRLLIGREEERKHLARELHDGPVQKLISLRYQLREHEAQINNSDVRCALDGLRDEIAVLVNELRGICRELRSPLLDAFGLASAIQAHTEEIGEQHGLAIQLVLDDDKDWQLPEHVAVFLLRIHQEALSNIIKHANASQVVVRLYIDGSKVTLEIQDDGDGFVVPASIEQLATEGRFGLLGIRERIELLKGEFELTSQPGDGTTLRAQVSIQTCEESNFIV